MRYLVSYDIACQRRRVRIAKLLLGYGSRVQESVFTLELRDGQWARLQAAMDRTIDPVQDQWRGWRLCARDETDAAELGKPPPPIHEGLQIV